MTVVARGVMDVIKTREMITAGVRSAAAARGTAENAAAVEDVAVAKNAVAAGVAVKNVAIARDVAVVKNAAIIAVASTPEAESSP